MAITIPDKDKVKPTTTPTPALPSVAKIAMDLPGPVKIATSGAASSKAPLIEYAIDAADGSLNGYYGFQVNSNLPLSPDNVAGGVVRGCIIDGFAGVTPASDVYLDPTTRPSFASNPNFSGLTHTRPPTTSPSTTQPARVGVGVTTTKIFFD